MIILYKSLQNLLHKNVKFCRREGCVRNLRNKGSNISNKKSVDNIDIMQLRAR